MWTSLKPDCSKKVSFSLVTLEICYLRYSDKKRHFLEVSGLKMRKTKSVIHVDLQNVSKAKDCKFTESLIMYCFRDQVFTKFHSNRE